MVGGGIFEIGKKYKVLDEKGNQIVKNVNGIQVPQTVDGSTLQNVKEYLESDSRFVLGNRNLARPGLKTDFLDITHLNFFNKKDEGLEYIPEDLRKDTFINRIESATGKEILELLTDAYKNEYKNNKIEDLYFTKDIYQPNK